MVRAIKLLCDSNIRQAWITWAASRHARVVFEADAENLMRCTNLCQRVEWEPEEASDVNY